MKIKLVIIGAVVIFGAVAFLPQTMDLIPNPPSIIDSVKKDLSDVQGDAIGQVEEAIEGSIDSVHTNIENLRVSSQEFLSTQVIPEAIIPIQYEEEIFYGKLQ